jgi:hypothetical protein
MKPTARLRFTKRYVPAPEYGDHISTEVRILQQWWMFDELYDGDEIGEWRDVPLGEEE